MTKFEVTLGKHEKPVGPNIWGSMNIRSEDDGRGDDRVEFQLTKTFREPVHTSAAVSEAYLMLGRLGCDLVNAEENPRVLSSGDARFTLTTRT